MSAIHPLSNGSDAAPKATMQSRSEYAEYIAILCHEIGNPLNCIIGLSHLLYYSDTEQKRPERIAMLRDSSNMLMALLREALDFSKLTAGIFKLNFYHFDIYDAVMESVNIVSISATAKNLGLQVHIGKDLHREWIGDALRIRQIIVNLLNNSIKFTQEGNVSLYINTQTNAGIEQLCIVVSDTGIGIESDKLEKIFGKYEQADSNIGLRYGGMGLGLFICKALTQLMGGTITAKSWPGVGSHFIVRLPLKRAALRAPGYVGYDANPSFQACKSVAHNPSGEAK
jgi:signal transduction histidine kinase